jgi:hypothetical protein
MGLESINIIIIIIMILKLIMETLIFTNTQ